MSCAESSPFTDGRDFVRQGVVKFATDAEGGIAAAYEVFGHELPRETVPVNSSEAPVRFSSCGSGLATPPERRERRDGGQWRANLDGHRVTSW